LCNTESGYVFDGDSCSKWYWKWFS